MNHVKDLLEEEQLLSLKMVNKKNINSLQKFQLKSTIKCIPDKWKSQAFNKKVVENFNTAQNTRIKNITTKIEYKQLIEKIGVAPNSELYFKNKLNIEHSEMREYYSIPFQATIYTKLRSFQFKINHNILYTKEKLHKIGIKSSPLCGFCNQHTETLFHLFVECGKIQNLWEKVKENLIEPYGLQNLTAENIILGIKRTDKTNNVVNHIILEVKFYIYMCSLNDILPCYNRLKNRLKITENIERAIASHHNKQKRHTFKWNHLLNHLLN